MLLVYITLKFVAQIGLPVLGVLYYFLVQFWGFPNGVEVLGTFLITITFLSLILGFSSKIQYDGSIDVETMDNKKVFSLNLNSDPEDLDRKKEVIFKVNPIKEAS